MPISSSESVSMNDHRFSLLFLLYLPFGLTGCASYYTHYGLFPAENSGGEVRQVLLSWQTAEYPDWWVVADKSTPITLTTQCSSRIWRLADDSHSGAGECAGGIRACGQPGQDVVAVSGEPANEQTACMVINPGNEQARVVDISASLELMVSCRPVVTHRGDGDDRVETDYLRPSSVTYGVYLRTARRGALDAGPPVMDDSICDAE
ncbi:MAG: hypothetical protein RIK85_15775 [Marinobacter sp.]